MSKKKKTVKEAAAEASKDEIPADVEELRREVKRLHREARKRDGRTQLIVDHIAAGLEGYAPPKAPPRPKRGRKKRRESHLLHLSDWQTGARTTTFDTGVQREMVLDVMMPKVKKLHEVRSAAASVDEIHVVLGGDQVDGSGMRSNHPWEVTETVLTQSMETCPRLTVEVILALMDLYPRVHVHAIRGNHGRSGPRKADPNPETVNWDTVASMAARLMLGDLVDGDRLTFDIEVEDFVTVFPCGGASVAVVHGDQFRGSGGFAGLPYYSIAAKVAKWSLNQVFEDDFDVLLFGHYHVPAAGMFGPKQWYLNGSLQTDSPFAREKIGATNRACQRFQVYDPEHPYPVADHLLWLS